AGDVLDDLVGAGLVDDPVGVLGVLAEVAADLLVLLGHLADVADRGGAVAAAADDQHRDLDLGLVDIGGLVRVALRIGEVGIDAAAVVDGAGVDAGVLGLRHAVEDAPAEAGLPDLVALGLGLPGEQDVGEGDGLGQRPAAAGARGRGRGQQHGGAAGAPLDHLLH